MNYVSHSNLNIKSPLSGKALAKRVRKDPPAQRAVQAARIARGEAPIVDLTTAQIALLTRLSAASVALAKNASTDELAALMLGETSLRKLRKANAKPREMTDADIKGLIDRVGPNRFLAILDQMTAPPQLVAAE
jgi:hypothetical protein